MTFEPLNRARRRLFEADRKAGKSVTSESFTSMGGIRCCDHGNSGAAPFEINRAWIG
jgi:hypothetical protein